MTGNRIHIPPYPTPVEQGSGSKVSRGEKAKGDSSFASVLEGVKSKERLSFSSHAKQRLESRSIELSSGELEKLEEAVDKAAAKGCRSSLLLYRDMAFLAGVPSRTIITAMDGQSMKDHVFTNIDSAVIVEE